MSSAPLHQPPARILYLHAGPHKTASTYLQARLQANRRRLEARGLRYPTPWREASHRHLARQLQAGRLEVLELLLLRQRHWSGQVLLSAEHFAPLLSDPEALGGLAAVSRRSGFALHVISFVRPQAELLDSFYAHGLARLYGGPTFAAYVRAQLAGRRPRSPARRRWMRMAPLALDYDRRFAPLLAAGAPRSSFLPFRPRRCDPFPQLLQVLGLAEGDWRQAPADQANEQLGRRGLGLAFLLNQNLDGLSLPRQRLIADHGLNRLVERIRRLARRQGWVEDRFSGWQQPLRERLQRQLGASNDRFARRVWEQGWQEVFPAAPQVGDGQGALPLDAELQELAASLFRAYRSRLPAALR
ncbi:MAG: hypothetical protein ACKOXO_00365 [Cyanobium sp.]